MAVTCIDFLRKGMFNNAEKVKSNGFLKILKIQFFGNPKITILIRVFGYLWKYFFRH